jgi:nucleotide-binding universal stress UspA family protein
MQTSDPAPSHARAPDEAPWVIGLDLGERSLGALAVGDWLAADEPVDAVHVLEAWSRPYVAADVVATVQRAVARSAALLDVPPPVRVIVLEGRHAEDTLAQAAQGARGLVIGRVARAGEGGVVRLGHVARRLLRTLPGPVVVVPRDLTAVAPGPVLLATDLGEASAGALEFATELAARRGRPLELVHVGSARHSELIDALEPNWLAAREEYGGGLEGLFERWAREHGLERVPRHLVWGDPAAEVAGVAATRGAALVVVGSRRLGAAARLFISSTASSLAASATCPVAVVPPA